MLDFNKYEWISFDCYGTLVDWETGISEAVAGVFARHGVRKSRAEILALFADAEPKVQSSGEFLNYRRVLTDVMQLMAWECSIRLTAAEAQLLPDSLPSLAGLPGRAGGSEGGCKSRFRLAVISNVDGDLFKTFRGCAWVSCSVLSSLHSRREATSRTRSPFTRHRSVLGLDD